MKLTTWLSRAFPLERRPAAGGLLSGFLLAVVLWLLLPLVPLGGAVRTASPPAAFLAAGLLLIAIHLIKTWRTAPTGSGS